MRTSRPNPSASSGGQIPRGDGTRQLLEWGASMLGAGVLAAVLLGTVLGGLSRTGASSNWGWFALIVALMSIPFGGFLAALGLAKALRNRALERKRKSADGIEGKHSLRG